MLFFFFLLVFFNLFTPCLNQRVYTWNWEIELKCFGNHSNYKLKGFVWGIKHDYVCNVGVKLPRVLPRLRGNTRGSLTPTIHIQLCLIPIIAWCHRFLSQLPIFCSLKQFKVWIVSNHNFRCHVTTLFWWQVLQSPPPPVATMRVQVFAGGWACEIELHQTGVVCFPWRQRSWSCGVLFYIFKYGPCSRCALNQTTSTGLHY